MPSFKHFLQFHCGPRGGRARPHAIPCERTQIHVSPPDVWDINGYSNLMLPPQLGNDSFVALCRRVNSPHWSQRSTAKSKIAVEDECDAILNSNVQLPSIYNCITSFCHPGLRWRLVVSGVDDFYTPSAPLRYFHPKDRPVTLQIRRPDHLTPIYHAPQTLNVTSYSTEQQLGP